MIVRRRGSLSSRPHLLLSRITFTVLTVLTALTALNIGCADRSTIPLDDTAETGTPDPGESFAGCMDSEECFDDWCLHPANEPGFCTFACNGGVTSCDPSPGGTATLTCLPVDGDEVCALDCGGNRSCPSNMRCEKIEANGQPRSVCF